MASSAQFRQQLFADLSSDLIGPSWDDTARAHEHSASPHAFGTDRQSDDQRSVADLGGEEASKDPEEQMSKHTPAVMYSPEERPGVQGRLHRQRSPGLPLPSTPPEEK